MAARKIDDRIVRCRKYFSNFAFPDIPRVRAPEVVDPEEAAFQQVRPEPLRILRAEKQTPDFLHDDDRTLEQFIVGQTHDQMIGLSRSIEADCDLRELRYANGEIDVRQRIVGQPTAAVAARILPIDRAAVVKASIEALGPREMCFEAAIDATKLRPREACDEQRDRHEHDNRATPHALLIPRACRYLTAIKHGLCGCRSVRSSVA